MANALSAHSTAANLAKTLLAEYYIWRNTNRQPAVGVQGVRLTPRVFIRLTEPDGLITAISQAARA